MEVGEGEASEPLLKDKVAEDPYLTFGYGVVSYFKFVKYMIFMFAFITLLNIPAYVFYSRHNPDSAMSGSWMTKYMLGNMGSSSANCFQVVKASSTLAIQCADGNITKLHSFGVIPYDLEADRTTC